MTKQEIKDCINNIIVEMKKNGRTKEDIAKMEIAFEYLINDKFREKLQEYVFTNTYKRN